MAGRSTPVLLLVAVVVTVTGMGQDAETKLCVAMQNFIDAQCDGRQAASIRCQDARNVLAKLPCAGDKEDRPDGSANVVETEASELDIASQTIEAASQTIEAARKQARLYRQKIADLRKPHGVQGLSNFQAALHNAFISPQGPQGLGDAVKDTAQSVGADKAFLMKLQTKCEELRDPFSEQCITILNAVLLRKENQKLLTALGKKGLVESIKKAEKLDTRNEELIRGTPAPVQTPTKKAANLETRNAELLSGTPAPVQTSTRKAAKLETVKPPTAKPTATQPTKPTFSRGYTAFADHPTVNFNYTHQWCAKPHAATPQAVASERSKTSSRCQCKVRTSPTSTRATSGPSPPRKSTSPPPPLPRPAFDFWDKPTVEEATKALVPSIRGTHYPIAGDQTCSSGLSPSPSPSP